ncbi:MAG: SDR family oxidoreductase [Bacteroidales bacterium]
MISNAVVTVTGGAGFIGSNLCEALLALGNRVICLDNFSTGKEENLASMVSNPDFSLIRGDIRQLDDCRKAVEGADYVLHQAALGSVPRSIADPFTTHEVNTSGMLNMLAAAAEAGVKRFVYASSSSVYGDAPGLPKVEAVTGNPLSPYAVTKVVNELYAGVYAKVYGLPSIGLRYFNVFGRRQDPDSVYAAVIPLFVKQLLAHESPLIHGDGSFSRDFTYINNVVKMNLLALSTENREALNRVYNTACGGRITLNHLVATLKEALGTYDPAILKIPIIHGPERPGDIPHSHASVALAERLLGYSASHSFEEGIGETVEWYWKRVL